MPSSEFASSPSMAMRRTISRALIPASTKTRVPLATSKTALPVEPLPSTEIFIDQFRKGLTPKNYLSFDTRDVMQSVLSASADGSSTQRRNQKERFNPPANAGGTDLIAT